METNETFNGVSSEPPITTSNTTKSKFTKEERKKIVREYESGVSPSELMLRYGIKSNSSVHSWKKTFDGQKGKTKGDKKERKPYKNITRSIGKHSLSPAPPSALEFTFQISELQKENRLLRDLVVNMILGKQITTA